MTTITLIYDVKREQWMAHSDTPGLPKILRIVPVFGDESRLHNCSASRAIQEVRECNPGCVVALGISQNLS